MANMPVPLANCEIELEPTVSDEWLVKFVYKGITQSKSLATYSDFNVTSGFLQNDIPTPQSQLPGQFERIKQAVFTKRGVLKGTVNAPNDEWVPVLVELQKGVTTIQESLNARIKSINRLIPPNASVFKTEDGEEWDFHVTSRAGEPDPITFIGRTRHDICD